MSTHSSQTSSSSSLVARASPTPPSLMMTGGEDVECEDEAEQAVEAMDPPYSLPIISSPPPAHFHPYLRSRHPHHQRRSSTAAHLTHPPPLSSSYLPPQQHHLQPHRRHHHHQHHLHPILPHHGASTEVKSSYVIHNLAARGDHAGIRKLLRQGVDPDAPDSRDRRALHLATAGGHIHAIADLLSGGASLEARDVNGNTALHLAVLSNRLDCALLLLRAGADAMAKDNRGRSPLELVRSRLRHLLALRTLDPMALDRIANELSQIMDILEVHVVKQSATAEANAGGMLQGKEEGGGDGELDADAVGTVFTTRLRPMNVKRKVVLHVIPGGPFVPGVDESTSAENRGSTPFGMFEGDPLCGNLEHSLSAPSLLSSSSSSSSMLTHTDGGFKVVRVNEIQSSQPTANILESLTDRLSRLNVSRRERSAIPPSDPSIIPSTITAATTVTAATISNDKSNKDEVNTIISNMEQLLHKLSLT